MSLIIYESPKTQAIRADVVFLKQRLADIDQAIASVEQAMYAFDREYQRRLGDLAESVLVLRAQLGIINRHQRQALPTPTQLVDNDYQQLKSAYRQAAKRCHPDHLPLYQRQRGLQLFDALNKAYRLQDLVNVKYILWLLDTNQAFSTHEVFISDHRLLAKQQQLLNARIIQKTDQLAQLKNREDYDVSNRDNWNILLYDYQTRLEDELALLRGRAKAITRPISNTQ